MNPTQLLALRYFISMGWQAHQSAGIVANLWSESKLDPNAVGDGGLARGVGQWHADRQANFSALIGKPIQGSSLEDQLAFVHAELRGSEKAAGDALALATDPNYAGSVVSRFYERPADHTGEAAKRGALAEQIYQQYLSIAPAAGGDKQPSAAPPSVAGATQSDIGITQSDIGITITNENQGFTRPGSPESLQAAQSMPNVNFNTVAQFLPAVMSLVPGLAPIAGLANLVLGAIPAQGAAGGSLHGTDYLKLAQNVVSTFTAAVPGAVNEQDAIQKAAADANVQAAAAHAVMVREDVRAALQDSLAAADKVATYDAATNAAVIAGRESAMHAQQAANAGIVQSVVNHVAGQSWLMIGGAVVALVGAMICKGIWPTIPDYVPMLIGPVGMIFGAVIKEMGAITSYYFDGVPSSNATSIARDAVEVTTAAKKP
jgi:hypothetical protein